MVSGCSSRASRLLLNNGAHRRTTAAQQRSPYRAPAHLTFAAADLSLSPPRYPRCQPFGINPTQPIRNVIPRGGGGPGHRAARLRRIKCASSRRAFLAWAFLGRIEVLRDQVLSADGDPGFPGSVLVTIAVGVIGYGPHQREICEPDRIGLRNFRIKRQCLLETDTRGVVVGAFKRDVAETLDAIGLSEQGADALEDELGLLEAGARSVMVGALERDVADTLACNWPVRAGRRRARRVAWPPRSGRGRRQGWTDGAQRFRGLVCRWPVQMSRQRAQKGAAQPHNGHGQCRKSGAGKCHFAKVLYAVGLSNEGADALVEGARLLVSDTSCVMVGATQRNVT